MQLQVGEAWYVSVAMTPPVAVGGSWWQRYLMEGLTFFWWLAAGYRSSPNQSGAVATVGLKLSLDTGLET